MMSRKSTASKHRILAAVGLAVLCALPLSPASADTKQKATTEQPQWFLLRHDKTGDCWPALLISVNGQYQHAFAQKAGGPYDSREKAQDREAEMVQQGVCNAPE